MYFLLDAANALASTTTETNSILNSEIIAALIGGGFVIIGTLIGNHSSTKAAKSQEQIRLLAEYYSEVFSTYTAAIPFNNYEKVCLFLSAVEKTKLFCSDESETILTDLEKAIADPNAADDTCSNLIRKLRKSAKEDLRNR